MGEKETSAAMGQAPAETGADLRTGGPTPEVGPSPGPNPEPEAVLKHKTKSNQSND